MFRNPSDLNFSAFDSKITKSAQHNVADAQSVSDAGKIGRTRTLYSNTIKDISIAAVIVLSVFFTFSLFALPEASLILAMLVFFGYIGLLSYLGGLSAKRKVHS